VYRNDRIDPVSVHRWDGPPTLAGELFLILLNDGNGRLRVQNRITGYVLGAAMLLDLYVKQRITLENMTVDVVASQPLPTDRLTRRTLGWLLYEPDQVGVSSWVQALATTAIADVAEHLEAVEWIRREPMRRGRARYEPVIPNRVFWRAGRLAQSVHGASPWPDPFLFALIDAAGFTPGLFTASAVSPPPRTQLDEIVRQVAHQHPGVMDLIGVVRDLTARVALAPR
jgi:hypothetical protein